MTDFEFSDYEKSTITALEQVTKTLPVLVLGSAYYDDNKSFEKFKDAFYNLAQNIRQSYTRRYDDKNSKEFAEYLNSFNKKFDEVLNLKKVELS